MELSEPVSDFPIVDIKQSDTASLLYSSGTTGISKGVELTHGNFIAACLMVTMDQDLMREYHGVFLCFLPMFHVFGLTVITYSQLQRGNAVVSMAKFELQMVLKNIEKYRVTQLWVVPPVFLALSKQSIVKKFDLSSLKYIGSGAAPLGKDLMEECGRNIPNVLLLIVWLRISFCDNRANITDLKGNGFFKEQKYPEAVKHYSEAIKRNPTDVRAYSNRAACYTKLGALPEGLKDAEKCIELESSFTKGYSRKGAIQFLMKEYDKAIETCIKKG